ncbi:mucin-5AC-like [Lucilia sericata]|uniref:mucin-5AC-like n=1 Tax=Lucilia sericata TaxID=13632 RepID=UPI0018A87528|nr:mucin-5AC-like [Lucilia sericata]
MRLIYGQLLLGLLVANSAMTWAQSIPAVEDERDKRAVTVDFGQFVRNLLLKSAAASETKANISRTVANLKVSTPAPRRPTTARTTTTTTTTTTTPSTPAAPVAVPIPFFFNKNDFFKFPFDLSGPINNKFNYNGGGYINFDYDDFVGPAAVRPGRRRRPTTTSTTTTTTTTTTMAPTTTTAAPAPAPTAAPLPPRRIPVPRRPFGLLAKQKVPYYDYYNDYDYNYDDSDVNPAPATAAPAPATSAPAPAATAAAPAPAPVSSPAPRPQKLIAQARVSGRIPQLRHRLVYQYRQPDDISINKAAATPAPVPATTTTAAPPPAEDNSNNAAEEVPAESAPTTNDYTDYTDNAGQDYNDNANADPNAQPNTLLNVDPNVAPNFEPNVTPNAAVPNVDPTVAPNNDGAAPLADSIADPLANPNADLNFNNDIGNINVPANYDFNAAAPYHDQFDSNLHDPSGIGNFIPPTQDFPFTPQQDFNSQYPLNTASHYSVRYY